MLGKMDAGLPPRQTRNKNIIGTLLLKFRKWNADPSPKGSRCQNLRHARTRTAFRMVSCEKRRHKLFFFGRVPIFYSVPHWPQGLLQAACHLREFADRRLFWLEDRVDGPFAFGRACARAPISATQATEGWPFPARVMLIALMMISHTAFWSTTTRAPLSCAPTTQPSVDCSAQRSEMAPMVRNFARHADTTAAGSS